MPEVGTPYYPIPPMVNAVSETYPPTPSPMQSEGVYTYPYMPPLVVPISPVTQVEANLGMLFTQSLPIQSSDELKEQEQNKVEFMMQLENTKTQQKVNLIEERLKAIEGNSSIKGMHAIELSLVLHVVIPHKFKMPDFMKYSRSSCPRAYMTMFCRKMVRHTGNNKMLIHYFEESLTGSITRWYMKLDRGQIHMWTDLVRAF